MATTRVTGVFASGLRGNDSKRNSIAGRPEWGRSAKENIKPRMSMNSRRTSMPARPSLVQKVSDENGVDEQGAAAPVKEGLLMRDAPTDSAPSKVRDQAMQEFDMEYLQEMSDLITSKLKAGKFEFSARAKEQSALVKSLRKMLCSLRKKQIDFAEACISIEEKLNLESEAFRQSLSSTRQEKDNLTKDLTETREKLIVSQKDLQAATADKDKLNTQHMALVEAHTALEGAKAETDSNLAATKLELEKTLKTVEFKNSELESGRQALEDKKLELAQMQQAHREESIKLQKDFNDSLDQVKQELAIVKGTNQALEQNKAELEKKLNDSAIEIASLQGNVTRGEEKNAMLQKECERYQSEISSLNNRLTEKGTELMNALESFNRAQRFHEERITSLSKEKKELEGTIATMRDEKKTVDETNRTLTRELESTQANLEKTSAQLEETTTTLTGNINNLTKELQESREAHETSNKNHVEAVESMKEEHAIALKDSEDAHMATKQSNEEAMAAMREQHAGEIQKKEEEQEAAKMAHEAAMNTKEDEHTQQREAWGAKEAELNGLLDNTKSESEGWKLKFEETAEKLETFKKCAGVNDAEQLEKLCQVSIENEKLRKQLAINEDIGVRLASTEQRLAEMMSRLNNAESVRRVLHNQIQELKGNVRVHLRVRPFLAHDKSDDSSPIECNPDYRTMSITNPEDTKQHKFAFDHVFDQKVSQERLFEEVAPLVQSSLDGYNVCLFSYGQTGSGKTHTMQGANMGDERGIIPRSIEKIMEEAQRLRSQGWEYKLEVTFLEIYNETVRDLLVDKVSEQANLQILINPDGGSYVPDLNRYEITERSQIAAVMKKAAKHRSVANTEMNSHSSRSHSVFTLHLTGINRTEDVTLKGTLNLCDLAGSERLDRSGATGDRLKETQAINKSLSCLADVFQALATKSSHVPYRNSKLTYLLQQCFSEQGKTMMMVNLSPTALSFGESLCSLRFASKVNQTEMGRPGKQVKNIKRGSTTETAKTDTKRHKRSASGPVKKP